MLLIIVSTVVSSLAAFCTILLKLQYYIKRQFCIAFSVREIKETLTGQQNVGWLSGNDGNSFNCSKQFMGSGKHITATFENLRIQPFGVNEGHFSDHGMFSCMSYFKSR